MSQHGCGIRFPPCLIILILISSATVRAQVDAAAMAEALQPAQIVQRMMESNDRRAQNLKHYTEQRHYEVEYRGFPRTIAASMDVEATYDAPSSKSFRILSQTGSKLLVDHVLKKLTESEREAAKNPGQTALSPENYRFQLVDTETTADQKLYVFQVRPRSSRKFLYRGKIWLDAQDYAVTRIEAEPAENPSFWTKKTEIQHIYSKTGDFWLPKHNRSETRVRTGGTAILTIQYGAYHIQVAH